MKAFRRLLGYLFLAAAVLLVAYGLFGLSHFAWYTGEYVDDHLVLFDNGFYPFFWGALLLVVAQFLRLHMQRYIMASAAIVSLLLLLWKRTTIPAPHPPQLVFPDTQLLSGLIVVCMVLLGLALGDSMAERSIKAVFTRLRGVLGHK